VTGYKKPALHAVLPVTQHAWSLRHSGHLWLGQPRNSRQRATMTVLLRFPRTDGWSFAC
jgi:hypothetical protein